MRRLLEMVPVSGPGAAEAMVRAVLKGQASAACCQQICGLENLRLWAQPSAKQEVLCAGISLNVMM